jgi:hypothetical protein
MKTNDGGWKPEVRRRCRPKRGQFSGVGPQRRGWQRGGEGHAAPPRGSVRIISAPRGIPTADSYQASQLPRVGFHNSNLSISLAIDLEGMGCPADRVDSTDGPEALFTLVKRDAAAISKGPGESDPMLDWVTGLVAHCVVATRRQLDGWSRASWANIFPSVPCRGTASILPFRFPQPTRRGLRDTLWAGMKSTSAKPDLSTVGT